MSNNYQRRVTNRLEHMHRMKAFPFASKIMDSEFTRQPVEMTIDGAAIVGAAALSQGYTQYCTVDRGVLGFKWLFRWLTGSHTYVKVYDKDGRRVMYIKWCTVCGQVENNSPGMY